LSRQQGLAEGWQGISTRALNGLTAVEGLDIELLDPPGVLTDTEELGVHQRLRTLAIENAYEWDPDTLPEIPALRELEINGTRKSTAAAFKARFKGTAVKVSVSGRRTNRLELTRFEHRYLSLSMNAFRVGRLCR
jgi:hypothetical protein